MHVFPWHKAYWSPSAQMELSDQLHAKEQQRRMDLQLAGIRANADAQSKRDAENSSRQIQNEITRMREQYRINLDQQQQTEDSRINAMALSLLKQVNPVTRKPYSIAEAQTAAHMQMQEATVAPEYAALEASRISQNRVPYAARIGEYSGKADSLQAFGAAERAKGAAPYQSQIGGAESESLLSRYGMLTENPELGVPGFMGYRGRVESAEQKAAADAARMGPLLQTLGLGGGNAPAAQGANVQPAANMPPRIKLPSPHKVDNRIALPPTNGIPADLALRYGVNIVQ